MTFLADMIAAFPGAAVSLGGFVIGLMFGALLFRSNFCTMGAISDWMLLDARGRLGATALAAAVAIVGTQALAVHGVVDLSKSIYLAPRVNWLGAIAGGLVFGAGMVYAGGCPSRALVRGGSGDSRALLALVVMALAGYATLSGIIAPARVSLETATALDLKAFGMSTQSLPELLALSGLDGHSAWWAGLLIAAGLGLFAFWYAGVWRRLGNLAGGLGVGILAVAAWGLTGIAVDEFSARPVQPTSLSFVKPVGDALDWIERATALGFPGFGAASVFGMLLGAFLAALLSGRVVLRGFADRGDVARHIGGAIAMGVGGVVALGCTIGQGVSGISTLSIQSLIACAAIFAGAVWALKRLERAL